MKDEIEILLQTSAPRFQKQTGLKYQMHLLDTPREMWEKINSWRAGMTCADHRRLVFLLCVRLVCSSLYSCVFGWIDFLFLWLSSGSSCFTEMKEIFSLYPQPAMRYRNRGIYRTAGIACFFSRYRKISQPHFLCDISFFTKYCKISQKYHRYYRYRNRKRVVHQVKYVTFSRRYRWYCRYRMFF